MNKRYVLHLDLLVGNIKVILSRELYSIERNLRITRAVPGSRREEGFTGTLDKMVYLRDDKNWLPMFLSSIVYSRGRSKQVLRSLWHSQTEFPDQYVL